ncbi:hypothetical protein [Carboxylicivirga caseinilyticus]|uniref:hypothetical protein n=1 Tax=Carboxylicivirga caseinilyticus TaxID=3417572 RepID=UPI003D3544D5|nr:hypothetical protein [Marinilabiliaceae bacterium A049]
MKPMISKIKSYLKELTIVTIGVLIALLISNYKEKKQAKEYYNASVETIKNEIDFNYEILKDIIENQSRLLDTINAHKADHITLSDLIVEKGGGLPAANVNNFGLEFYKKNEINSVDFEMMSRLIRFEYLSKLIDIKMEKLMDYLYPNLFIDSEESKQLTIIYLNNLLESEITLMLSYEDFINKAKEYKNTENKQLNK